MNQSQRYRGGIVTAMLLLLLVTVIFFLPSCKEVETTAETTQSDPGFSIRPTQSIRVETDPGGDTIRLYVDEDKATIALNEVVSALKTWTLVDSEGNLCADHIIRAKKSGDSYTVSYGPNKIPMNMST